MEVSGQFQLEINLVSGHSAMSNRVSSLCLSQACQYHTTKHPSSTKGNIIRDESFGKQNVHMRYISQGSGRGFFSYHQVLSKEEQYRCGHEAK
jgi:hypothetical protein